MALAPYLPYLDWLSTQSAEMIALTERWANINSGSYNIKGLRTMRAALADAFATLGGMAEIIPLAPLRQIDAHGESVMIEMAEALTIRKRPEAKLQVLFVGHMDTVYGIDHPFQKTMKLPGNILNGPGVADLKGGLVIMLHALMALERSPWAENIGWQVSLNPDEEIGSIASDPLLKAAAAGKTLGLVYEPALADGTLAGARKGSGNFTIVVTRAKLRMRGVSPRRGAERHRRARGAGDRGFRPQRPARGRHHQSRQNRRRRRAKRGAGSCHPAFQYPHMRTCG